MNAVRFWLAACAATAALVLGVRLLAALASWAGVQ